LEGKTAHQKIRFGAQIMETRLGQNTEMAIQKAKIRLFQKETFLLVGLFLLAFAIRLIYLNQIKSNPYFDTPQMDELWHHNWAKEIAGGDWIGKEVFPKLPFILILWEHYVLFWGRAFIFPG
jgi:hypothetical protein